MQPYSMDLRQGVLADCDAGLPTKQVAEKYTVSRSWVRRLKQRHRQTGEVAPRPSRNRRQPALAPQRDRLRELIAATPDLTLRKSMFFHLAVRGRCRYNEQHALPGFRVPSTLQGYFPWQHLLRVLRVRPC
jgi:transposase